MTPGDTRALVGHQLGAYRLEALLTIGGLPECFRARHVELGREVAVKLLPGTLAAGRETLDRLRDEARRVSALKHPNILPIYGVADAGGFFFAVTPVPRESLRDQLDREDLLPATHAVRLAAQLAWALHALHGIGFVHGDVQPGTLLFDTKGTLNLADFGVARALVRQRGRRSRVASRTWPLAGARTYVAPEVAQTGEISVRGDIYALGAVLYEMLIGTLPRQQAMLGEMDMVTAPLPASMRSSDAWPELAAVALKALERDPARRYADAREFAIALRHAVRERPETPKGPSLLDALVDVWHPEVEDAMGNNDGETFKKRLATMPPTPAQAATMPGATFKKKPAAAPPTPQRSRVSQPAARKPTAAPAAAPPHIDQIATQLLPDRPPIPPDQIATQLLPDRPPIPPPAPRARPAPPATTPQSPVSHSRAPAPPFTPRMGGGGPEMMSPRPPWDPPPAHAPRPANAEMPGPDVADCSAGNEGYVSPDELARALAGRQPGRTRRITAAAAGLALLLAFGAGTAGILSGFGHSASAGPPAPHLPATATVGALATPTNVPAPATATRRPNPTPRPTATPRPTPTATPRPTATHTATPSTPPATSTTPPATPTMPPATPTMPPATPTMPPATPTVPPATPTVPPATPTSTP